MSEIGSTEFLPDISKVLVTGATGFLGRHLVARLEALGKTVVGVSRRTGIDLVRDELSLEGIGHVFHAGARTGVAAAWQDPVDFLAVNTLGTARVLDQCRRHGCGISFISAYVYGTPERLPIQEADRIDANNPYALSKFLGEQVCSFYTQAFGVRAVILRLFNIYGPGQSEDFLVPLILRQVLDPQREVIEVMDLAPSRDYVFISDAIEGVLQSTGAEPGSIFNIGSGEAHSVEQVIQLACAVAGIHKPYVGLGRSRHNEIDSTVADTRKLRDAVGWRPRVSLECGLRQIVESMRTQCRA